MNNQTRGRLYLLPAPLQEFSVESWDPEKLASSFPALAAEKFRTLENFIVESEKTAYRLLSRFKTTESMKRIKLSVLDEHSTAAEVGDLLAPLLAGEDAGFFSEAGMPCIADPGAALASQAHMKGIKVVPVTGPSSILLALVGSGLDAQRFMFLGYLPAEKAARKAALSRISRDVVNDRMTRLFIETPYRNDALIKDCLENLNPDIWLSVASDLCGEKESLCSGPVRQWRSGAFPPPGKIPAVFALGFPASLKPKNTA